MPVKQVIVLRTDLNMRKGKMCAQAAHASMKVLLDAGSYGFANRKWEGYTFCQTAELMEDEERAFMLRMSSAMQQWLDGSFTKICVGIGSEDEFLALRDIALAAGLPCAAIQDSGFTEFHGVPTWTALAIGPAEAESIDKITGLLKLL